MATSVEESVAVDQLLLAQLDVSVICHVYSCLYGTGSHKGPTCTTNALISDNTTDRFIKGVVCVSPIQVLVIPMIFRVNDTEFIDVIHG